MKRTMITVASVSAAVVATGLLAPAAAAAAAAPSGAAAPAAASRTVVLPQDVERRATCTATSRGYLDIDRERRGYEVSFDVEARTAGQRWRLVVSNNGTQVYSKTKVAIRDDSDRDGEVEWEFWRADRDRTRDQFVVRATNLSTGEVCSVSVRA